MTSAIGAIGASHQPAERPQSLAERIAIARARLSASAKREQRT